MTKLILSAILLVGTHNAAFGAIKECRSIVSDKDRLACFDRQFKPQPSKTAAGKSSVVDPVDALKIEHERVGKRLKGIFRGC